jgi:glycosyltransferase involved in cell wall biosynthesis
MKLLTIYIPSYNRADSLLKQLHSIKNLNDINKIKVIVNDNCSSGIKGYEKVQEYCIENSFTYKRNKINVGADANIFNGFLNSFDSKYIWILSDDDLLKMDAVEKIVTILEKNSLDILFFTHSKIAKLEVTIWSQRDFYKNNIQTADGAGLISNVIYKTEFIKSSIPTGFQYIYTHFAHLAVLIDSLRDKNVNIGRIESSQFFIPDTNLPPPEGFGGYDHSYFGFVLLGELFDQDIKKDFVNGWTDFWNLRHWHKKYKNGQPNSIYAKSYIKENLSFLNFFRAKLFFWKIFLPLYELIKGNLNREMKDRLLKIFRVKF